ncbi:MAG: AsmA family protein [Rhodospirillaceae bacterium]|nr:AsmA family protein [Rhodospirillaceae bacterium]
MSRRGKIWLGVVGGFAALVASIVVFFDWNWFRPYAEAQAAAELGRPVRIGHLDVKLAREPTIIVDRFEIGNPPEFPEGSNLAEFERMVFTVDLNRYWRTGVLFFPEMSVTRPVLKLETDAAGKPNWVLDRFKPSTSEANAATTPEIGRLNVENGHVSLNDPKSKTSVDMSVSTEPDPKGGDSSIVIRGKGRYANARTQFEARAGSLAAFRDVTVRYPVDLIWEVGNTRAHIVGTVLNRTNLAGIDGKLEVSGPDMALLYPMTGIPWPSTPPYKLAGHLWHSGTLVHFDKFDGRVGSSDFTGSLAVDTGGPRLVLTGEFASSKTVLADLAGFVGGEPGKAEAKNATPQRKAAAQKEVSDPKALPEKKVGLERLNEIDAHVIYRVRRLESDYLPLDDLTAKLDLVNGRLRLKPLNFGIGKGRIAATVDLDARRMPARWDIDADFRNIDLKRILQKNSSTFDGAGLVGGRAQIVSTGQSAADVLGNGDGHLTLAMTSGQISALLTELAGLDFLEALGFAMSGKDKQFGIRCMVLDAGIQDGVLRTNSLVLDTTDTNIAGTGWVSFRDETLGIKLEAHPKDPSLLSFRAPVHVSGTLKNPKVGIDAAATGARVGAMAVLGALLTPLAALIPTIELGLGKDSDCSGLIDQAARSSQQADPSKKATPAPQNAQDPTKGQKARR